jgi:RNA polymerase sigma-70 factor (ECF subfamily)
MTVPDRVSRERLLRDAVLRGDVRAWQILYDESFDELLASILWSCAGRRDLADEVVQETWLAAVRQIRRFDPEQGGFSAWLGGIGVNCLRNSLRRHRMRQLSMLPLTIDPVAETKAESPLEQHEQSERIAAALVSLPNRYEAVLKAKYFERSSVAEIAAAWNETPKAVESLLTRAREAFRRLYQNPGRDRA